MNEVDEMQRIIDIWWKRMFGDVALQRHRTRVLGNAYLIFMPMSNGLCTQQIEQIF